MSINIVYENYENCRERTKNTVSSELELYQVGSNSFDRESNGQVPEDDTWPPGIKR